MMRGGITLTFKYCSPEEEQEIITMYKTGAYSYNEIAGMKNLSKGTVINIVRGYPYNKDKEAYYSKLQTESIERLEQEIVRVRDRAQKAHCRDSKTAYALYTQQWLILLDMLPEKEKLYERLKGERTICEQKAWEGFAETDYSKFGFYADTWELLTEVLGDNLKSPFKVLAKESNARGKSRSAKFSGIDRKGREMNFTAIVVNSGHVCMSDTTWRFLRPLVRENEAGRPSDHRRILNGILYALANCRSFRTVPREYGDRFPLTAHFAEWYKADVFTDLLAFVPICPELEPVKAALLQIEKHRLMYGDLVPRLCDIRKGAGNG